LLKSDRQPPIESITCGSLSCIVIVGLFIQVFKPGWWWVDNVASLTIVAPLVKEGREAGQASEAKRTAIAGPSFAILIGRIFGLVEHPNHRRAWA
jgi:hypothetical protein